jgi:hypothetical protein
MKNLYQQIDLLETSTKEKGKLFQAIMFAKTHELNYHQLKRFLEEEIKLYTILADKEIEDDEYTKGFEEKRKMFSQLLQLATKWEEFIKTKIL